MSPTTSSIDETIVRLGAIAFNRLFDLSECFSLPKAYTTVIVFAAKNMRHLFEDQNFEKEWKKTKLKDAHSLEKADQIMIVLLWTVLMIGKEINSYHRVTGLQPTNWIEEATEYDKRRKANATKPDDGETSILPAQDTTNE